MLTDEKPSLKGVGRSPIDWIFERADFQAFQAAALVSTVQYIGEGAIYWLWLLVGLFCCAEVVATCNRASGDCLGFVAVLEGCLVVCGGVLFD